MIYDVSHQKKIFLISCVALQISLNMKCTYYMNPRLLYIFRWFFRQIIFLVFLLLEHYPLMNIWNKAIHTKVSCLVKRLVQNMIATKDNIVRKGLVLQGQDRCIEGCGSKELVSHLFFECHCFTVVWSYLCKWLNISSALHNDGWQHMIQFENIIGGGR